MSEVLDRLLSPERTLSEYVPWLDYYQDNMVLHTDASASMMLSIDGLPFDTIDDALINHRHHRLEAALRDVATDGLTFHVLQCRGTADESFYPCGNFRTTFAEQLDQHYRDKLFSTRSMWLNRTFLAVHLEPRRHGGLSGIKRLLSGFRRGGQSEAPLQRIDQLRRIVGILSEELRDYSPRTLGIVERNRRLYSEIAEAVALAMTGHWRQVPLTTSGADAVFSDEFIVGHESFEVRMPHASAYGACLNMHDYPYMTEPGMFDRFLSASYRHTIFHAFQCMPSNDGQVLATRRQNRLRQAGDRALSQAVELTKAADLIASNRMMVGKHAFAATVFVDDPDRLQAAVQKMWGDLQFGGVKVEREKPALEAVLFSMIPGNFHLRGRKAAVSSRNFAAFASLHNFPTGEPKGFWGEPIALLRNAGGGPFRFHFHVDGVGNAFIAGATGSGKTTILGFLLCQAERAGAQIILWDKDHGLEALVRALSGSYLSLVNAPGLGSGLAPLKCLTDSVEDLAFLSGLIRACIATPEPYNLTPEEDRRLGIAIRHVMALPPGQRSLSEVRAFLGTSRHGAGARLEKWCRGGEFGWIIDCERDIVSLDGRVIAFDQSAILDDPIASGAIIATLFHYTGKLVDGRRLLFLLDEVWNALKVATFHGPIKNGLKTWRKYNSPLLMATQDVGDALNSPIADAIRGQSPTQIYFSDPTGLWEHYGPQGMHLSATEYDIVQKLPKGSGKFLLRQGTRSDVLEVPLRGLDEVKVISGTRRGADALKLARERTKDADGMPLVAAYHQALEELSEQ